MSSSPHPMIGKLWRLKTPVTFHSGVVPEDTLLLVVGTIRRGSKESLDYITMFNGITENIPEYWVGWRHVNEAR